MALDGLVSHCLLFCLFFFVRPVTFSSRRPSSFSFAFPHLAPSAPIVFVLRASFYLSDRAPACCSTPIDPQAPQARLPVTGPRMTSSNHMQTQLRQAATPSSAFIAMISLNKGSLISSAVKGTRSLVSACRYMRSPASKP